jgi:protein-disulfide isomerase
MTRRIVRRLHRLGANSTPTWFLENGRRYQWANPLDEVTRLLDATSPANPGFK